MTNSKERLDRAVDQAEKAAVRAAKAKEAADKARDTLKKIEKLLKKERSRAVAEKQATKKAAIKKVKKGNGKKTKLNVA